MTTFAQLGIEFISKGAAQAANDIARVEQAAATAERSTNKLGVASKKMGSDAASARTGVKIMTDEINRLVAFDAKLGNAKGLNFAPMARGMDSAAASAKNLGPQIQNASFQIGDMAVQVAGGTDALRALTMQLPQLLGSFGILGAVAGGAAAVIGALVPTLFDTSSGANRLSKEMDALSDSVSTYKQFADMANAASTDMAQRFGYMSGEMSRTSEFLAKIARVEAIQNLDTAVKTLSETFGEFSDKMVIGTGGIFSQGGMMREWQRTVANLRDEMSLTEPQVDLVWKALARLTRADGVDKQILAANELNSAFERAFGSIEKVPKPLLEVAKQAGMLALQGGEIADQNARVAASATEVNAKYQQQIEMSRAILSYGSDSAQVEAVKRAQADLTARAMLEQKGLTGQVADETLRAAMQAYDLGIQVSQAEASLRGAEAAARALAGAMAAAAGFSANLDNQIAILDAQIGAARNKQNVALAGQVKSLELQATATRDATLATNKFGAASAVVAITAEAQYQTDLKKIGVIRDTTTELGRLTEANGAAGRSSGRAGGAAKKAGGAGASAAKSARTEVEKLTKSLDDEATKWREMLDPTAKYRREIEDLAKLKDRLSTGEMAKAQEKLNAEFADSLPLVGELTDTLVDGLFKGFKGSLGDILGVFKNWLGQMIATAAKNRIVMSMGFTGGGVGAAAAQGVGGVPGMGGLGTGISAIGSGLWGGASSVISGFASGGLSGGFGAIGTALSGATSGLAGLATAAGALALPLAGLAAVFSFFKGKTKLLDSGLRITASNMDALIETFKKTEKTRFWGLSKKRRTSYSEADAEVADPVISAITKAQTSILDMAKVVGFAGGVFDDFTHQLEISTKDLSEEEILKAVAAGVEEATDAFAAMIPGLTKFGKEGEGASETLTRLVTSLKTVNGAFDTLNYSLRYAGLTGADTASKLANLFGGMEGFSSATSSYWETFYSEAERQRILTRQATAALKAYNVALPRSRNAYRALIEAQDLTTEKGRKLWSVLVQMAGTMDTILPSVAGLTRHLEKLQGRVSTALDGAIESISEMVKVNAQAASDWYSAADKARDLIASLRGTAGTVTTKQQALLYNQTKYLTTYAAALSGDLKAAQNITGIAQSYLTSVNATARTREDAAVAQARVLSQMELLGGASDIEGARHDIMSGLYQKQVDLMTNARDYIAAGNALTKDMIAKLQSGLGSIDDAIDAAAKISYSNLRKQIEISLDVVQDAKIPPYLKNLLKDTTKGVDAYVDFITRSDLSPDLKWLALNKSSDHLKTIEFVADNRLGPGLAKVALDKIGKYQLNVETAVEKGALNADQLLTLITGTKNGKITLGGSFVFDPAKGFATLIQTSMESPLKAANAAMNKLSTALGKLHDALVKEASPTAPGKKPGVVKPPAAVTPTKPSNTQPALSWRDFAVVSKFAGKNDNLRSVTVLGPKGGTRVIPATGNWFDSNDSILMRLFQAGKLPAFAAGGDHVGGLRIVGENGPELEATGPSRIYNARQTSQMLSGTSDELVAEVRALRAELAAIKVQAGRTADSVRSSEKLWKKIDAVGLTTKAETP